MRQDFDEERIRTGGSVVSLADYRHNRFRFDDEPQPPSPRPLAARPAPAPVYIEAVALEATHAGRRRPALSV